MVEKKCNKCGETMSIYLMVPHIGYKCGYAPLCRECSKKKCLDYWRKHYVHKRKKVCVVKETPYDLSILIKNGYARNEEEAKKYMGI